MDDDQLIAIERGKRGGKPSIRRMRIAVANVLADFPELTAEDLRACLAFAADRERRLLPLPASATPIPIGTPPPNR